MKKVVFFIASLFFLDFSIAQTPKLALTLTVKTATGGALSSTKVDFVETATRTRLSAITNASGIANVLIEGGKYWQIEILEIKDYLPWQFTMHDAPVTGKSQMTITYNLAHYLRETEPQPDRKTISFKEEKQKLSSSMVPKAGTNLLIVYVKKLNGNPNVGIPVVMVNYATSTNYLAQTNSRGEAVFMLPVSSKFQIDLGEIENFGYFDTQSRSGMIGKKFLTYEPTIVKETNNKDTIVQYLPINQEGTTDRDLVTLKVNGGQGGFYSGIPVYLAEIGGSKTYQATTNEAGVATFLLPKGKKYMIHFEYQKDVDVFDLTRSYGISKYNKTRNYIPNPRLQFPETFIPKPEELYIQEFKCFLTKQFEHKDTSKTLDFNAYFGNKVNPYSREAVLNIEFTVNPSHKTVNSPPINLAFVIDKSGSMAGYERIENLKSAMLEAIDRLRPEDKISLVVFESEATLLIPAQKVGTNKNKFVDEVLKINADGGTNIYLGLKIGYAEVSKFFTKGQTNRVVLLTDGYGETPVDTILNFVAQQKVKGIGCSVVGVGQDYNVALLQQMGDLGGGLISLINNSSELHQAFANELSSLVLPVAKDIKVEIEYNKRIIYSQLYGFPLDEKTDSKVVMKLQNAYLGLNELAMVRFNLHDIDKTIEQEPIKVRLKYFDLASNQKVVHEKIIYLEWTDFTGELELQKDINQKKMYAIAVMNQSLKVMAEASVSGNYALAKKTISETIQSVEKTFPNAENEDVDTLRKQLEEYLEIMGRIK